jgi:acyl-coenzyme A thioesterase PaaI-like protein
MKPEDMLQNKIPSDAPIRNCYGCGADNHFGLQMKSYLEGDEGICRWRPAVHHCSYPGFLNGGVACTIIDCHAAWTAYAIECRDRGEEVGAKSIPTGWTRAMKIEFLKPVPISDILELRAKVAKKGKTSRTVTCSIYAGDEECVSSEVTLVFV